MAKRISGTDGDHRILLELGKAIRERRLALGLSQEALAHKAGIDRSHMGKIERGERNVTLLNIEKVAAVLGCKPSELLAGAGFQPVACLMTGMRPSVGRCHPNYQSLKADILCGHSGYGENQ